MLFRHKPITIEAIQYTDPSRPPPGVLVVTQKTLDEVKEINLEHDRLQMKRIVDWYNYIQLPPFNKSLKLSKLPPDAPIGTAWISGGVDSDGQWYAAVYTPVEINDWIVYQEGVREQIAFPVSLKQRGIPLVMSPASFNEFFEEI